MVGEDDDNRRPERRNDVRIAVIEELLRRQEAELRAMQGLLSGKASALDVSDLRRLIEKEGLQLQKAIETRVTIDRFRPTEILTYGLMTLVSGALSALLVSYFTGIGGGGP